MCPNFGHIYQIRIMLGFSALSCLGATRFGHVVKIGYLSVVTKSGVTPPQKINRVPYINL